MSPPEPTDELPRLVEAPPPPRRTDAAFARAVADDVHRRRRPLLLMLSAPALALAAAGVAITIAGPGSVTSDAGVSVPRVAAVDGEWDEESDFALPSLEGSTDEELLRLDRALDEALQRRREP